MQTENKEDLTQNSKVGILKSPRNWFRLGCLAISILGAEELARLNPQLQWAWWLPWLLIFLTVMEWVIPKSSVLVIPTFLEHDWPLLSATLDDGHKFTGDYKSYHEETTNLHSQLRKVHSLTGDEIILQQIGLRDFEEWARNRDLRLTANTRVSYAEFLVKQDRDTKE